MLIKSIFSYLLLIFMKPNPIFIGITIR